MREENDSLQTLKATVEAAVEAAATGAWEWRRSKGRSLLEAILEESHRTYFQRETFLQQELDALNRHHGWSGDEAQTIRLGPGRGYAYPKYHGGNPEALLDSFIAVLSLNHRPPVHKQEAIDWQSLNGARKAHTHYFQQRYVYRPFFGRFRSIANGYRNLAEGGDPEDWKVLQETMLFIEVLPTTSLGFGRMEAGTSGTRLEQLNGLAYRVVMDVLKPAVPFANGKEAWFPPQVSVGALEPVGRLIRPDLGVAFGECDDRSLLVVRSNFAGYPQGPNSLLECNSLGRLIRKRLAGRAGPSTFPPFAASQSQPASSTSDESDRREGDQDTALACLSDSKWPRAPSDVLPLIEELVRLGMDNSRFASIHLGVGANLRAHVDYCKKTTRHRPGGEQPRIARRLAVVLQLLRNGESWEVAIGEARRRYPPVKQRGR